MKENFIKKILTGIVQRMITYLQLKLELAVGLYFNKRLDLKVNSLLSVTKVL